LQEFEGGNLRSQLGRKEEINNRIYQRKILIKPNIVSGFTLTFSFN